MALDQAILNAVAKGDASPTIRVYGFSEPACTIGCFQCLTDELHMNELRDDDVQVTRRISGGGALYHDQEVMCSVIAPEKLFSTDIAASYGQACKPVLKALQSLGITAKFRPLDGIVVDTKKVGACAQTRQSGVILQQCTIVLSVDSEALKKYLRASSQQLAGVLDYGVSAKAVVKSLRKELTRAFRATSRELGGDELSTARDLAKEYADQQWVAQR